MNDIERVRLYEEALNMTLEVSEVKALLREHGAESGDYRVGCMRCEWVDRLNSLLQEPPPADNDHVAEGASLFPEGTSRYP